MIPYQTHDPLHDLDDDLERDKDRETAFESEESSSSSVWCAKRTKESSNYGETNG
jgi:hypothetical protein